MFTFIRIERLIPVLTAILCLAGCSTPQPYFDEPRGLLGPAELAIAPDIENVRDLRAFSTTGRAMSWFDIVRACDWADIIVIGEQHDDAVGHAVQRAVTEDVTRRHDRVVLALEMLERHEQPLIDDYVDGIISAEQFARLTFSESWAGEGSWAEWFQPIIDAALENGGSVLAANAPRRYVRYARFGGYEALDRLPRERRRLFDHPGGILEGPYKDRFYGLMTAMRSQPEPQPEPVADADSPPDDETTFDTTDAPASDEAMVDDESPTMPPHEPPATSDEEADAGDDDPAADEEEAGEETAPAAPPMASATTPEALFRSQLVWDTTMAQSVATARSRGANKVILLVGQFHSDFEGGTVQQIRNFRPFDRVLVISMQREWPDMLLEDDRDRADIIIYTGERPEPEPEPEPQADDTSDDEPENNDADAVANDESDPAIDDDADVTDDEPVIEASDVENDIEATPVEPPATQPDSPNGN